MDFAFPDDFPKSAINRVVAAEITAKRAVSSRASFSWERVPEIVTDPTTYLVFRYVLEVFATFTHEACELGRASEKWNAQRIDRESHRFLRWLLSGLRLKFDPREYKIPPLMSDFTGEVLPQMQRFLETSAVWIKYHNELLEVVEFQSNQDDPSAISSGVRAANEMLAPSVKVNYLPTSGTAPSDLAAGVALNPDHAIQKMSYERKKLRDNYLTEFQEKIYFRDICWAAKQHYREWTRWLTGELKDGSKPDRAFRAVLLSHKRPEIYRPEERPKSFK